MTTVTPHLQADYSTHKFMILAGRSEQTVKKLEQLSARAQKLGLPPFRIILGESEYRRSPVNPRQHDHYRQLTVTGGVPKLQGWQFFAKIEHTSDGNVVRGFSGTQEDLERIGGASLFQRMTECPSDCDHCNTRRQRNTTFFFLNQDSGDVMQVGSTCVADFSGHTDPMLVASLAQAWPEIIHELSSDPEDVFGTSPRKMAFATKDILAASAAVVRKAGRWIPRAEDDWGLGSSAEVEHLLATPKDFDQMVTGGDRETATHILEWLGSDDFDNQGQVYRHNLQVLARQDFISRHNVPLLASAVAAWNREQMLTATKATKSSIPNIRLGEYDKKIDLDVVIDKVIPKETRFGVTLIYLMRDLETNARVVWFNSGRAAFFEGDHYRIQGTVKGWEDRDGIMQTKLTRVTSPEIKLIEAIKAKNDKAIEKHFDAAVHINSRNAQGENALIVATELHRYGDECKAMIERLLAAGAKPDILDNDNRDRLNAFDRLLLSEEIDLATDILRTQPELVAKWDADRMALWGIDGPAADLILRTRAQFIRSPDAVHDEQELEDESQALGLA